MVICSAEQSHRRQPDHIHTSAMLGRYTTMDVMMYHVFGDHLESGPPLRTTTLHLG